MTYYKRNEAAIVRLSPRRIASLLCRLFCIFCRVYIDIFLYSFLPKHNGETAMKALALKSCYRAPRPSHWDVPKPAPGQVVRVEATSINFWTIRSGARGTTPTSATARYYRPADVFGAAEATALVTAPPRRRSLRLRRPCIFDAKPCAKQG